jgi:hypothetical protein
MLTMAERAFEIPPCAWDWVAPGDRVRYRLPQHLHGEARAAAHKQLAEWDALVGKLLRESLFGDGDPREVRQTAEAVAAEVDRLAVALGVVRTF